MKNKLILFILILNVPVFFFLTLELSTRLYQSITKEKYPIVEKNSFQEHKNYILRHHVGKKGKDLLWDVTYKLDIDTGYRLNDLIKVSDPSELIYLLGGSFPFGQNLNDQETLAYSIHQLLPNAQIINLSRPAMGPHDSLKQLQSVVSKEAEGHGSIPRSFYYFIIDDHIGRSVGDLQHFTHLKNTAYYPISRNGEDLKEAITFAQAFPFRETFFPLFEKSQFLKLFNFNPPLGDRKSISSKDIRHYCLLIKEMRDSSMPSQFKAVFLPAQGLIYHKLSSCLEELKIHALDLTMAFSPTATIAPGGDLFSDYHPRAKYHKRLAPLIFPDVP